ncbi:hypothetical protein K469DRAFT_565891 [Zopfia rhizophila CBS 207.26]|uniref:Zn(2)-C6 fungal-type domain-containing protein n=1 Tax=Zopfia rhizophila CBS 207.26 TaxID=1314779 RepID=A0A6A6EEE3_9PEZI|nr:hypothetical protein K469DRAFT_565891 [Zopfia rhizophila CBS 207.26]
MNSLEQDLEPKRRHVSSACDACRARKVKCLVTDGAVNCFTCTELNIACTYVRPRKRRGPKNRYVQDLQSNTHDLNTPLRISPSLQDDPNSPENLATSLDAVAPRAIVKQILDDWFELIHPVAPIFHRGQFIERLSCRESVIDASFLVLVASVCAATVAGLERRRSLYGSVSVQHCLLVAERLGFWTYTHNFSLERCQAAYNFATATWHEHGMDSAVTHRLAADAIAGVKFLLYYQLDGMPFMDAQLLKRLYWLLFAGQCTADMLGRPMALLHSPHEQVQSLIPLDISDDELLRGVASGTPASITPSKLPRSYVPGLNFLSQLFTVWHSSRATPKTISNLQDHINRTQHVLDSLPPELTWKGHPSSPQSQPDEGDFGTDVQTVNLKVTQLHIRSNLLEQINSLARSQGLAITRAIITEERHRVVDELLDILYHMPHEVFDANGYSVVPKIRDIGSTLLDEAQIGEYSATVSLDRLLAKLENLDVRSQVEMHLDEVSQTSPQT